MSLWVMAGVASVTATTQVNSSTKVYIDDRTVTCNSAPNLFRMFTAWQSWSQSVGLVESVSKTRVATARPAMAVVAGRFFEGGVVQPAVKVLGAVSACARRALHSAETARLAEAKKVIRLLACCHFLLDNHLRCVRQFAISKANFGWVSRSPTWAMSHRLFTASFVSSRRVRYSSPWIRALFLGGNLHLDVVWVTRLVAAILRFRLRSGALPSWSGKRGSCAACLRQWMAVKGFTELHPWAWFHEYAHVKVDLAGRVTAQSVGSRVGLRQHNIRQGWRAWIFQRWLGSGRHELLRLPQLSCEDFRSLELDNTRKWILSAAPAASVALGATFSPGHWSVLSPPSDQSSLCVWGCGNVGFWDHICWSCPCRPASAPQRPVCPLLARFGWVTKDSSRFPDQISQVRNWLAVSYSYFAVHFRGWQQLQSGRSSGIKF